MTKKEIKERVKLMQLFIKGEKIQVLTDRGEWVDDPDPQWHRYLQYRVKPKLKARPYENAKECFAEATKHRYWVYNGFLFLSIIRISDDGVLLGGEKPYGQEVPFSDFASFIWADDGTHCRIEE